MDGADKGSKGSSSSNNGKESPADADGKNHENSSASAAAKTKTKTTGNDGAADQGRRQQQQQRSQQAYYVVEFDPDRPLGMWLEPVLEASSSDSGGGIGGIDEGCQVSGFDDEGGTLASQARESGEIRPGDVVAAVDGQSVLVGVATRDIVIMLNRDRHRRSSSSSAEKKVKKEEDDDNGRRPRVRVTFVRGPGERVGGRGKAPLQESSEASSLLAGRKKGAPNKGRASMVADGAENNKLHPVTTTTSASAPNEPQDETSAGRALLSMAGGVGGGAQGQGQQGPGPHGAAVSANASASRQAQAQAAAYPPLPHWGSGGSATGQRGPPPGYQQYPGPPPPPPPPPGYPWGPNGPGGVGPAYPGPPPPGYPWGSDAGGAGGNRPQPPPYHPSWGRGGGGPGPAVGGPPGPPPYPWGNGSSPPGGQVVDPWRGGGGGAGAGEAELRGGGDHGNQHPPSWWHREDDNKGGPIATSKWNTEQDATLRVVLMAMEREPTSWESTDWELVSKKVGHKKTAKQCWQRWTEYVTKGIDAGKWKFHDDERIIKAVTEMDEPFHEWTELARGFPGRTGKRLRERWHNILNPNLLHSPFTQEEDGSLFEGVRKFGTSWTEISRSVFQKRRSEGQLRNRWNSASFRKRARQENGIEWRRMTDVGGQGPSVRDNSEVGSNDATGNNKDNTTNEPEEKDNQDSWVAEDRSPTGESKSEQKPVPSDESSSKLQRKRGRPRISERPDEGDAGVSRSIVKPVVCAPVEWESAELEATSNGHETGKSFKRSYCSFSKWNTEQDSTLRRILMTWGKNQMDWESVAKELGQGKSAQHCWKRWIEYSTDGIDTGKWKYKEDEMIIKTVAANGGETFEEWTRLSHYLPGRAGKQVRDRWINMLNPRLVHSPFTKGDDEMLLEGIHKYGKRWTEISRSIFLSKRSDGQLKNRGNSAAFREFARTKHGSDFVQSTIVA